MNEYVGRSYIKAVDAGDTIFVHMFGAYFGLAASRSVHRYGVTQFLYNSFLVYKI